MTQDVPPKITTNHGAHSSCRIMKELPGQRGVDHCHRVAGPLFVKLAVYPRTNEKTRHMGRVCHAEGGTRTHMGVSPLRPERSASASFATSASKIAIVAEHV
jgi:hypothetical protein